MVLAWRGTSRIASYKFIAAYACKRVVYVYNKQLSKQSTKRCKVARIVKLPTPDGKIIEGEEVDFKPTQEPWCVYQLEDGNTIRFKAVVTQIIRTGTRDAQGNPIYVVKSSNVLSISPPETFKRKELQ